MQVYEGLTFKLSLKFPTSYPYEAPQVTFVTPCFHPNVDQYGNICLDILKEKWSAVYNVRTILLSIQSLLGGTQRPPARMRRALSSPRRSRSAQLTVPPEPAVSWQTRILTHRSTGMLRRSGTT